jgi:hypothetical protein
MRLLFTKTGHCFLKIRLSCLKNEALLLEKQAVSVKTGGWLPKSAAFLSKSGHCSLKTGYRA